VEIAAMTMGRKAQGRHGEAVVARWYQAAGFEVVARNWRTRAGELDLVARSATTLVFCEVKSRSSGRFGTPLESVRPAQIARIRRAAVEWMAANGGPRGRLVRFDVAAVQGGRLLEVVESAY
jgi:putative endonuclease